MTKAALVEEVARVAELTKKHSEVIVDAVFESIINALQRGEKIELRGFGSFRLRRREPRKGRNPKTGDRVDVPSKRVPYVILNKYPYNNGHLMVVPFRHIGRMADADSEELSELIRLVRLSEMVLDEAYNAHGINVGMNLGRSAGAGVPGHLHVHLVPRWEGDTNFMSVVGNTRVVPEEPADSVSRLKPIFQKRVATD